MGRAASRADSPPISREIPTRRRYPRITWKMKRRRCRACRCGRERKPVGTKWEVGAADRARFCDLRDFGSPAFFFGVCLFVISPHPRKDTLLTRLWPAASSHHWPAAIIELTGHTSLLQSVSDTQFKRVIFSSIDYPTKVSGKYSEQLVYHSRTSACGPH